MSSARKPASRAGSQAPISVRSLTSSVRLNIIPSCSGGVLLGMASTNRRTVLVLFHLGGPDSLEAIEPFLYNLFCDPDIIDFPFAKIGRKPLAKLISVARARKLQHH